MSSFVGHFGVLPFQLLLPPLLTSSEYSETSNGPIGRFGGGNGDGFSIQKTPPKLLVVDDDPMLIKTAVSALRSFAIPSQDVLKADAPRSAIESFDAHEESIRVILSDMMMPGGTGLDLYRHIRPKRPNLAFAIWSGGMPDGLREELDAVLASDPNFYFFEKPVPLADLTTWFRGAWLATAPA